MLKKMKIKKPPSKEIRGPVTLKLVIINNKNQTSETNENKNKIL